ncbi:MAG TPA: nucleotide sugar dehydrogenase [Vicinamibacterales bacterium]|nr:nucleotide sugar dehydrogenase [Vicinamibacterales bacterium]
MTPTFDVCVVGGAGHVGAPLAIVLAAKGLRTAAYDINREHLAVLARGKLPFLEEGGEDLLRQGLARGRLCFTDDVSVVAGVPVLVVTVGTPIDEYHNPHLNVISRCLDQLLPYLSDGQSLILRSTVYPGVTEFVDRYLIERGKRLEVAFCPERVVQGKAIVELQALPQIVSGLTPVAEEIAAGLFGRIAPKIVRTAVREAEFAKLVSNAYRYIQFAAANEFYQLVTSAGVDYDNVLRAIKDDYPRMRDLPGPGFAAGPCLMKDTMQLVAFNNRFSLGRSAMTINEGFPNYIVDLLARDRDLSRKRIGILGMAFKADIDDIRDSLSYKLAKILRFRGATVMCSDEHAIEASFVPKDEVVRSVDILIVAVPHRAYSTLSVPKDVEVIDLWNILPSEP